jgi:uncharacterized protein YndB with AHSA1/START domain
VDDDGIFRALADPNRRALLDSLRDRGGQTLGDLCRPFSMTRYGVMKHISVLEDAGLVVTERVGREKHHFLNPVPIQIVYERWVSRFARPWAGALTSLKRYLEEDRQMEKHVQMVFIRSTAEEVWRALTTGDMTRRYYFGTTVEGEWRPGGAYRYTGDDGTSSIDGEVVEVDPPHLLVTTFRPLWVDGEPPETRVTWRIEEDGEIVKVTIVHEGLDTTSDLGTDIVEGWARILSGLKTLLETGAELR